jgi:hypothetical protein
LSAGAPSGAQDAVEATPSAAQDTFPAPPADAEDAAPAVPADAEDAASALPSEPFVAAPVAEAAGWASTAPPPEAGREGAADAPTTLPAETSSEALSGADTPSVGASGSEEASAGDVASDDEPVGAGRSVLTEEPSVSSEAPSPSDGSRGQDGSGGVAVDQAGDVYAAGEAAPPSGDVAEHDASEPRREPQDGEGAAGD